MKSSAIIPTELHDIICEALRREASPSLAKQTMAATSDLRGDVLILAAATAKLPRVRKHLDMSIRLPIRE